MFNININDHQFLPHLGCKINFNLGQGEVILFTGPNGLGKTTLMRRLYVEHQSQSVLVLQKPLSSFYDRRIGKIKDIILDSKMPHVDSMKFIELWNAFGLEKKNDRFQSALSGGEDQALKLCLALAIDKPLYILDEPSQHLDEFSKSILDEWIRKQQKDLKSIILVEHDLNWQKFHRKMYELQVVHKTLMLGNSWTL
jgi:ATPase subunit of ABC transporter with duplicated ATPase domains